MEVVEEKGCDEKKGFWVGRVEAGGEEEEGEPKSWAFHEEPGQGRGHGGAPTWAAVLAIGGLEEPEGDVGWGCYEVEAEEAVVEEVLI